MSSWNTDLKHLAPTLFFVFPSSNFGLEVTWETRSKNIKWTQIGNLIPIGQPENIYLGSTGNEQASFMHFGRCMHVKVVNDREAWI